MPPIIQVDQLVKRYRGAEANAVDGVSFDVQPGELGRLGIPHEAAAEVKVPLGGRSAHAILKSIDTPLTLVQTHTPTLEDAYLKIVGAAQAESDA